MKFVIDIRPLTMTHSDAGEGEGQTPPCFETACPCTIVHVESACLARVEGERHGDVWEVVGD